MNTDFLRSLVMTVEHGSMAEAARRLNLTPAAVAQHVQGLERELGAPLLLRNGRTVAPTEACLRILDTAHTILRELGDLRAQATDDALSGELRLAAGTNALQGVLPDVLAGLLRRYPALNVHIRPGYSIDMYPAVERGEIDAAVVLQSPVPLKKSLRWMLLREEPLVVLAPQHRAGDDPHRLLAQEPLIRYDRAQWGGQQAERYLQLAGIRPRERLEINALNAIAVMVDRGLGVSLVPDWIHPWPEGLRLTKLALPLPFPPRRIGVIWSHACKRMRLVEAFLTEATARFPLAGA